METIAASGISTGAHQHSIIAIVQGLDLPAEELSLRRDALEVAEIVRTLDADDDIVTAAILHPLLDAKILDREAATRQFGAEPVRLARSLNQLGELRLPADWSPERALESRQAEALRKMLLAVVDDVRLVVVRLAEQLQRMRAAKLMDSGKQHRLALETREIYAPLANRLGIWQLKWELEDLAFRYLQPEDYKQIATSLKVRRSERERSIEALKTTLQAALTEAGITAIIEGRPKHIYSIWRKMQAKQTAFENLMDIRAARIRVNTVAECYAALGVVHSLWRFIPGEFDDYIATPKGNLYRSIHTAVIGPSDEPVEIQIRTHDMHASSERGVAAHWRYKEGGRSDQAYERKINQLRILLTPADTPASDQDFLDRIRLDLFQDRIYVLSPRGDVVDVPTGGTPLDFAYQVHTDLGHRTRGAKVNGRMVPLDYSLKNGETIEIITAKSPQPSRDWLSPRAGFLASPRHRNKVRAWFRKIDDPVQGEAQDPDEPTAAQITGAEQREAHAKKSLGGLAAPPARAPESEIHGVGDLLSVYAKCCKPVPPEAIVGYVTVGRGVSIHAQACPNFRRLRARTPARVLAVAWDSAGARQYPVEIEVRAFDRRGLLRDVSAALTDESISIQSMNTVTDKRDQVAYMQIGISISGLPQLALVLGKIAKLPNVISARRKR
jgi:GTP pyrophosphokinase